MASLNDPQTDLLAQFTKEFTSLNQEIERLRAENAALKAQHNVNGNAFNLGSVLTEDSPMREFFKLAEQHPFFKQFFKDFGDSE